MQAEICNPQLAVRVVVRLKTIGMQLGVFFLERTYNYRNRQHFISINILYLADNIVSFGVVI